MKRLHRRAHQRFLSRAVSGGNKVGTADWTHGPFKWMLSLLPATPTSTANHQAKHGRGPPPPMRADQCAHWSPAFQTLAAGTPVLTPAAFAALLPAPVRLRPRPSIPASVSWCLPEEAAPRKPCAATVPAFPQGADSSRNHSDFCEIARFNTHLC